MYFFITKEKYTVKGSKLHWEVYLYGVYIAYVSVSYHSLRSVMLNSNEHAYYIYGEK